MSKQKGRKPAEVIISDDDREFLESLIRISTATQAQVLRAKIALGTVLVLLETISVGFRRPVRSPLDEHSTRFRVVAARNLGQQEFSPSSVELEA